MHFDSKTHIVSGTRNDINNAWRNDRAGALAPRLNPPACTSSGNENDSRAHNSLVCEITECPLPPPYAIRSTLVSDN